MTTKQNQKYTFTYQQSDSNRQAIIDNKPSEFKSTPDHATERSMMEVAKSGPFACPCPLMYAEKCDEAMWFRARAEYLTQKKYEDDKTIRKLKQEVQNLKTHRDLDWAKHLVQQEGFEIYEYQNNEDTIELAEYVALEGHGAVCIYKMKTLDPDCLLEQSCDYLEGLGWTLTPPAITRTHIEDIKHFAAVEYERTGRKPDELWTEEETGAFRVKLTAHNEEARRRHEARQKAAAEAKLDDTIIGLIAVRQQNEFEKGEHDRPWCAEAEEQFRELLMFMPFEGKQKLQLKYNAEN